MVDDICFDCLGDCSHLCGIKLHGKRFKGHEGWRDAKGKLHARVKNETICGIKVVEGEGRNVIY